MHDLLERNRRVFAHLQSLCANKAAEESLEMFRQRWDERCPGGEDTGGKRVNVGKKAAAATGGKWAGGSAKRGAVMGKVREKKSWLEGLIGGVSRKFN